jgi:hypothetical protein
MPSQLSSDERISLANATQEAFTFINKEYGTKTGEIEILREQLKEG